MAAYKTQSSHLAVNLNLNMNVNMNQTLTKMEMAIQKHLNLSRIRNIGKC